MAAEQRAFGIGMTLSVMALRSASPTDPSRAAAGADQLDHLSTDLGVAGAALGRWTNT